MMAADQTPLSHGKDVRFDETAQNQAIVESMLWFRDNAP